MCIIDRIYAGSAGDVNLTADGAITDDGDTATVVTANLLTATADGPITLETTVSSATVSTSKAGNIQLDETNAITLASVTAYNGNINVTAGDINVVSITAGNAGDVTLTAAGAITEDTKDHTVVTGGDLTATATGAITLDTTVDNITASSTTAGAITIDETNAVTLKSVTTANGGITVTAGGTLTATLLRSDTDNNENDITLTTTPAGDIAVVSILSLIHISEPTRLGMIS